MISIRMIKICDICRLLKLIFLSCLESGKFPNERKKANEVRVHKKGDKQILKNYRPISLLPIAGKIFERLLYDKMFEFFIANNLRSKNQSGFRPGDYSSSYSSRETICLMIMILFFSFVFFTILLRHITAISFYHYI